MNKVIISYKKQDRATVLPLIERIETAIGESCVQMEDDSHSDKQIAEEVLQVFDNASVVVLMYSHLHAEITNYTTDWTIRELNYAHEAGKQIVFVGIDGTPLTKWFTFMFPLQQMVNALLPDSFNKFISDLPKWIKAVEGQTIKSKNRQEKPQITATEGLQFIYDTEKHEAIVSGIDTITQTIIQIPSSINHDGDDYTVTKIGDKAFKGCYLATTIHLPDTIQHIGADAFAECNCLTSIIIPEGVTTIEKYTFNKCYNLQIVRLPKSLTAIMRNAFDGCQSLSSITLPEGLEIIESGAFLNCLKLSQVTIPSAIKKIEIFAFLGTNVEYGKLGRKLWTFFATIFGFFVWGVIIYLIYLWIRN